MVIELLAGMLAHSLAIISDAAHLLSDFSGFAISIVAVLLGRLPATRSISFGFHRFEIIGALGSVLLIWGLTIWLIAEAIDRIRHPVEVTGYIMLITAVIGLVVNCTMLKVLHSTPSVHHSCSHDHDHGCGHGHDHGHGHGHEQRGRPKKKHRGPRSISNEHLLTSDDENYTLQSDDTVDEDHDTACKDTHTHAGINGHSHNHHGDCHHDHDHDHEGDKHQHGHDQHEHAHDLEKLDHEHEHHDHDHAHGHSHSHKR